MAGYCNQGYNMEDHDEGHTNFEMDELRRQLQKLQQRLEQYENQGRGARHHDFESDDENPFHRVHSHSSSGSTPLHPRLLRNLQLGFDMKRDLRVTEVWRCCGAAVWRCGAGGGVAAWRVLRRVHISGAVGVRRCLRGPIGLASSWRCWCVVEGTIGVVWLGNGGGMGITVVY
ncbi:hypothetical protein FCV25MIE_28827 [Fagus crenata]